MKDLNVNPYHANLTLYHTLKRREVRKKLRGYANMEENGKSIAPRGLVNVHYFQAIGLSKITIKSVRGEQMIKRKPFP